MRELKLTNSTDNLNKVYAVDAPGSGNANHEYEIRTSDKNDLTVGKISFQHGGRNTNGSKSGLIHEDLLEIVKDRLVSFQTSKYACEENAVTLKHVQCALDAIHSRILKRKADRTLGINKIGE